MKTYYNLLLATLFLLLTNSLSAQKEVKFEIRHWLGDIPFALNTTVENNNRQEFTVTRLEYYVSEFAIVHDSGQVMRVPDTTFLIHPTDPTLLDLGSFAVDQVEGISFHIGVDSARNHLDLALYPVTHPLGPKSPSMHWGWASGYRFVAIEGKCGNLLGLDFQLHGLGDANYFKAEIMAPMVTPFADGVIVSLDADYTKVLNSIHLDGGVIVHGEQREARTALINLKNQVFSPASPTTAIEDEIASQFQLFPNPSNGQARLTLPETAQETFQVRVTDMIGRQLMQTELKAGQREISLEIDQAGMYMVTVSKAGRALMTKKLVVN